MTARGTLRKAAVTLIVAIACLSLHAQTTDTPSTDSPAFLKRALFAQGRLWVLSDAGELSTIEPNAQKRVMQATPDRVADACAFHDQIRIITSRDTSDWSLRQWNGTSWMITATVTPADDDPIAMDCGADETTLLTSKRIIQLGGHGELRITKVASELPFGTVTAMHDTGDSLLVAFNAGEWGGGLQRIDKASGAVTAIERRDGSEPCSGPLNAACDSVQGVVAEPWNARCDAVAVGLVHMIMERGGIMEVCGNDVRPLFVKPITRTFTLPGGHSGQLVHTLAFYGVTASGSSLWAVSADGLYRIDANGKTTHQPLPTFQTVDGIDVSFDNPQLILVMTRLNQRHAVSGATPMLVPR